MAKPKPIVTEGESPKSAKVRREEVLGPNTAPESVASVWAASAAEMRQREFKDIDEAMQALVEAVIVRMEHAAQPGEELKTFLFELLDSDPELKETLTKILRIGVS